MKSITLIRHAQSAMGASSDFERNLTDRGRMDCRELAGRLQGKSWVPDLVLCSSAQRTQETAGLLLGSMELSRNPVFSKELYLASLDSLYQEIHQVPETVDNIWLLGHNPGLSDLVYDLGASEVGGLATCSMVRFEIIVPWRDCQAGCGTFIGHLFPTG